MDITLQQWRPELLECVSLSLPCPATQTKQIFIAGIYQSRVENVHI
jgi:hypothetical protein